MNKVKEVRTAIFRILLMLGCAYEIVALIKPNDKIPTITRIIRNANEHKFARVLVWLWCGYVAAHFLDDDPV